MPHLRGKERSGSKRLYMLILLICHFLPSYVSILNTSFEVDAVYSICEARCGGSAFSFDEFLQFVQKDTSPTLKCQKKYSFLSLAQ